MHILLVKQEDKTGVVCIGYLDLRYFGLQWEWFSLCL